MAGNDVEQAIQRLTDASPTLTLDQRLRIAALLAQPPNTSPPPRAEPHTPTEMLVLTVEETADMLKVGRTTVYDLIKSGHLTSITIGRLRRIPYTDLLTYLEQTPRTNSSQAEDEDPEPPQ
jgi:excisionase family DNA binding protein